MKATLRNLFRLDIVRIVFPSFLAIVLFIVFLFWYMLPTFEKSLLEKKKESKREMVQIIWNLLDGYEKRIAAGDLSPEKGRTNAIKMIRNLRYGEDESNYFWINDLAPRMIMHPYRPDLEGILASEISDPSVKHTFAIIIEAIKESDSNYIEYTWRRSEDFPQTLHKISHIRLFKPWNWVIGTGIYISEFQEEMNRFRMNIALMSTGILLILLLLSLWTIRQRFKSEAMREYAEAQIQNEKRKLRSIIEFLPDATFVIDETHRVIAWNRAMEQMTGIRKDAILGQGDHAYAVPFYGYARPVLIDYVMERNRQITTQYEKFNEKNSIVSGEAYVPLFRDGKGGSITITASPLVDENGRIAGAIESIRDITEQKKNEAAIRASEENYRSIFNGANEAFFIHDPETGAILEYNQKACEMCEIQNPEKNLDNLASFWKYDAPQKIEEILQKIREAAQGIDKNYEKLITNQAGRSFWVEVNLKKIVLGGKDRVMAVLRDIHSRKIAEQEKLNLEEQLQQSQKMEAVGKLAGGVAHDFNNILTVIQGYSEMALGCTQPGETIHHNLEEVKKAASRAESITRQLLAFSRRQIIQPQVLNINSIIQNLGKMLNRLIGENIEMRTLLKENLYRVKVDPSQLEQVIINLAINARDAMPNGGAITLETRNASIHDQYAQQHIGVSPGEYVLFSISDTGGGMDKETQTQIFEPFFTTKKKGEGTGLGLSIVYGIVKQNHGNITVYSEVGKGSIFNIYLPAIPDDVTPLQNQANIQIPPHGHEAILVVEDEASVLHLIEQILRDLGYSVLCADDIEKARQIFDAHQNDIALLLTDVIMPALNGRQLAEQLTEKNPSLKVIFMSGYTDDAILHHVALEEGIAFIQKPFNAMDIALKIRAVLDSDRPT